MLIENNWEILSLNYMDGYLYFITMADPEDKSQEDKVDNKIHRMKTDGTEDTVINLIVSDKYIIGGDVSSVRIDGEMKPLSPE